MENENQSISQSHGGTGETSGGKPWYLSKTMWGGLIILISLIARQLGFEVSSGDEAWYTEQTLSLAHLIAEGVGMVLVFWGRVTATKRVTLSGASKLLMFATLGVALSGSLAACAATDQGRLDQQAVVLEGAIDSLNTLHIGGFIDDETYVPLVDVMEQAVTAHRAAQAALEAGNDTAAQLNMQTLREALDALLEAELKAQQAKEQSDDVSGNIGRDQRDGDGGAHDSATDRSIERVVAGAASSVAAATRCGHERGEGIAGSGQGAIERPGQLSELASLTEHALKTSWGALTTSGGAPKNLVGVGVTPSFSGVGAAAPESFTLMNPRLREVGNWIDFPRHARRSEPGILQDGAAGQALRHRSSGQLYQTLSSSSTRAA